MDSERQAWVLYRDQIHAASDLIAVPPTPYHPLPHPTDDGLWHVPRPPGLHGNRPVPGGVQPAAAALHKGRRHGRLRLLGTGEPRMYRHTHHNRQHARTRAQGANMQQHLPRMQHSHRQPVPFEATDSQLLLSACGAQKHGCVASAVDGRLWTARLDQRWKSSALQALAHTRRDTCACILALDACILLLGTAA
jgi:hypothetical protein